MKLAEFYATIAPLLTGRAAPAALADRLYAGERGRERDLARLAIYARFCRNHRFEVLDSTYALCRRAIIARHGTAAWDELVEGYFERCPMWHVELNANGHRLAEHLAAAVLPPGSAPLAPWLPELADFEWWSWQVRVAPDEPDAARRDEGRLRIAETAELRPYQHDLCAFVAESEQEPPGGPTPRQQIVLFWRDRDLDPRAEPASPIELLALKAITDQLPLDEAARLAGVAPPALVATVDDLHAAGILRGDLTRAAPTR